MSLAAVPSWTTRLSARIYQQFQATTWASKLAAAVADGARELDEALRAALVARSIDPVTDDSTSAAYGVGRGAQLDRIGRVVGQPRGAATDAVYRLLLRARILANRSRGGPDQVIDVFVAMFAGDGAPRLIVGWVAAFTLRLEGVALDPLAVPAARGLLGAAAQAGVRAVLEWTTETGPGARVIRWNSLEATETIGDKNSAAVGGFAGGAAAV